MSGIQKRCSWALTFVVIAFSASSVLGQSSPTLSVTKTHAPQVFFPGGAGSFSITISANTGSFDEVDFTVTDTLDPAFTIGTPTGDGWTCSLDGQEVICTGSIESDSLTVNQLGSITIPVTVTANASGTISNTVNASGQYFISDESETVNAQYTDMVTVQVPQIAVTKTNTPSPFIAGQTGSFAIQVSNSNTFAYAGTFTATDTLDPAFTVGTPTGTGWTCQVQSQTVTCSTAASTPINANAALPTITVPVTVAVTAIGTISNTVDAQAEIPNGNGTSTAEASPYTDTFTVLPPPPPPQISVTETHTPPAFVAGSSGILAIQSSNSGMGALTGTFTVTAALDPTLTVSETPTGSGWTCQVQTHTVTCGTAANTLFPASTALPVITVPVNVAATANGAISNTVNGQVQFATQSGTQTVTATPYIDHLVVDAPLLRLTTTLPATVQAGGTGTFGITITNIGTAPTSGTLNLTYALASTFTPGPATVTGGWTCQTAGQVVTCSTATTVAVNGSTNIGIPFSVSANATGTVTNTGTASGGGAAASSSVTNTIQISPFSITIAAPSSGASGQPVTGTISAQLSAALDTKLALSFASNTSDSSPVCDPTIAVILANSTSTLSSSTNCSTAIDLPLSAGAQTQNFEIQTGTTAGTITLSIFAPGGATTPYQTQQIVIAPAKPTINSVTIIRNGDTLQVEIDPGFSNTRQVTQAIFHFVASSGNSLRNADLTLDVSSLFSTYFVSSSGLGAGGSFIYTQPFTLTGDASKVASVTVTLVNNQGSSDPVTSQ